MPFFFIICALLPPFLFALIIFIVCSFICNAFDKARCIHVKPIAALQFCLKRKPHGQHSQCSFSITLPLSLYRSLTLAQFLFVNLILIIAFERHLILNAADFMHTQNKCNFLCYCWWLLLVCISISFLSAYSSSILVLFFFLKWLRCISKE